MNNMDDDFNPLGMPDDWQIAGHDQAVNPPTPDKGLIITGLGGKGKLFRYFVVIASKPGIKLKPGFQKIIRQKFSQLFTPTQAELEKVTIKPSHIELLMLVSMDEAVDNIVMPFIKTVNSGPQFLLEHYLAVNNRISTLAEIRWYLKVATKETG